MCAHVFSGGHGGGETPVPIPNTVVKTTCADGTWGEAPWESRALPLSISKIGPIWVLSLLLGLPRWCGGETLSFYPVFPQIIGVFLCSHVLFVLPLHVNKIGLDRGIFTPGSQRRLRHVGSSGRDGG